MSIKKWKADLEAIGDRRVPVDKAKWLNQEEQWTSLVANIPLCAEVTPRFYDLVTETRIHVAEIEHRKDHAPFRFIDTSTDDLVAGVERAFTMLRNAGLIKERADETRRDGKKGRGGKNGSGAGDSGSVGDEHKGNPAPRGEDEKVHAGRPDG